MNPMGPDLKQKMTPPSVNFLTDSLSSEALGVDNEPSTLPTSKKQRKAQLAAEGFGNHPIIKHLMLVNNSKKGTKPSTHSTGNSSLVGNPSAEIKIEELDEELLRKRFVAHTFGNVEVGIIRLEALESDLSEYKKKCLHYKSENEWYRAEIEATKKDTAEYIEYLHSKKSEKQAAIDRLIEMQKQDQEFFSNRKKLRDAENKVKIEELKALAVELEAKLEGKQQEIMHLSDVMTKRARHEAEIAKIRKEIAEADAKHAEALSDLERNLLEVRMKLQKEADAKIAEMESAAQEKAAKYLSDHTTALEAENRRLESQLRKCILTTQEFIARKDNLEKENRELSRRLTVRDDMLKIRIDSILRSQAAEGKQRNAKNERAALLKSKIVAEALTRLSEKAEAQYLEYESPQQIHYEAKESRLPLSASIGKVRDTRQHNSRGSGAASRAASRGHTSNPSERATTRLIVVAGASGETPTLLEDKGKVQRKISEFNYFLTDSDDDEYL
ncbi:hypothetical protein HDU67_010257 [Dinochytrium kinnereticum]|nr:hypothetical protein HDU67_010257 [Dinochytrium kinnereticum]